MSGNSVYTFAKLFHRVYPSMRPYVGHVSVQLASRTMYTKKREQCIFSQNNANTTVEHSLIADEVIILLNHVQETTAYIF